MVTKSHLDSTIQAYEDSFDKYLNKTTSAVTGSHKKCIDYALSRLSKSSTIFEIGSGTGRDADYIEELGYTVIRSDVANSFINYNESKGKKTIKYNVVTDNIDDKHDLIIALAVFLHFNEQEFDQALNNVYEGLNEGGIFLIGLKNGVGEEISTEKLETERYFKYWTQKSLQHKLGSVGFDI